MAGPGVPPLAERMLLHSLQRQCYPVDLLLLPLNVGVAGGGRPRCSPNSLTRRGTSDRLPSRRLVTQQAQRKTGSGGRVARAPAAAPSPSTAVARRAGQGKKNATQISERSSLGQPRAAQRSCIPAEPSPAQPTSLVDQLWVGVCCQHDVEGEEEADEGCTHVE